MLLVNTLQECISIDEPVFGQVGQSMGIGGRIKFYRIFLAQEFSGPKPTIANRLRALRIGHKSRSIVMLPAERRESGQYLRLSKYGRRLQYFNRHLYHSLHSKIAQKLWLDKVYPAAAPPMTHYLTAAGFVPIGDETKFLNRDNLRDFLEGGALIFKPHDQGQGRDVLRVELSNDGTIIFNGKPIDDAHWHQWVESLPLGMTVSRLVCQSDWSARYQPDTLSTLRIMTFTSFVDPDVVLMGAAMKCARAHCFPADNFHCGQGSISAGIDLSTGELSAGISASSDGRKRISMHKHPETGAAISGETVPEWPRVKQLVTELAALLPAAGLVGWDIALSDSGPIVLELNALPGLDVIQSSVSLMDTPEKRKALREMRLI